MVRLPYNSRSLSLRMMSRVSTASRIFSSPSVACALRRRPSNWNGMVTMPTVRMSISRAACAMTGAAPVPVPPPMPAVMKTMLVLLPINSLTSSRVSIAALRPTSGKEPAPCPPVRVAPSWTLTGTGLASRAWASVLQTMKSTPWMPRSYMVLTALEPPPPTPMTLIGAERVGCCVVGVLMSFISILFSSVIKFLRPQRSTCACARGCQFLCSLVRLLTCFHRCWPCGQIL